jgi:hypothetical protein
MKVMIGNDHDSYKLKRHFLGLVWPLKQSGQRLYKGGTS